MPRLPRPPRWSDSRREAKYETAKIGYDAGLLSFKDFRSATVKLIEAEKKAVANKQKRVADKEAQKEAVKREKRREAERKRQEEVQRKKEEAQKKKAVVDIRKRVTKALDKKQHAHIPLTILDQAMGLTDFVRFIISLNKEIVLKIGDVFYVINENTRDKLLQYILGNLTITNVFEDSAGVFSETYKNLNGDLEVYEFAPEQTYQLEDGGFFKYTHKTVFDLKQYGVYKTGEAQNHDDCCLVNALIVGGMEDAKIEAVKQYVKNRFIPQSMMKDICKEVGIQIHLKKNPGSHKHNTLKYGTEGKIYIIGLLESHYFIINQTKITRYCLENYDAVCNEPRFNEITGKNAKGFYKREERFLDSFDVIKILLENKHLLNELTYSDREVANSQFYNNVKNEVANLEYDEEKCKKTIEYKEAQEKIKYTNLVFDFETYTKENGTHVPYLVRTYSGLINKVFYGEDCGLKMLFSLSGDTRLIAHNANYDYRFLIQYLTQIKEIARGNRLISISGMFNKHNIQIKDTYLMISMPLRNFPKTFGLESVKEVMPYALYNDTQMKNRYVNIQHVLDNYIVEKDKEQFLNNIKRWALQKGDEYDIVEYSSKYCELDCKILWDGYHKFRQMMLEHTDLDIDNILTVASLSHKYFVKRGCYEGVYELGGSPQLFIQGCVVGGRTMTAENKKIMLNEKVNDFDAVSLYPSAMARMPGFLKGLPKVLANLTYEFLQQQDGYFVEVLVQSVGINRKFPLMSQVNDKGVRMFDNSMVGQIIRVDKTTLEDLIEFQQIKFQVVRGYYFNDGYNTKIGEVIKYLFEKRLELKKIGNPAEMIYKLIMNSGYGKSIMKPVESETKFFDDERSAKVYITRHYNWITSFVKFGNKTKVCKMQVLSKHFNIAHVGVCILSMSKRIMNEVMCLAEDNDLDLYYQDTDSMHIKDYDIATLSSKFADKYGRTLIGKNMGQFHSDFDLKGCKDIYARRSVFLGKKAYCDEIVGVDVDGNEKVGYHIRMKGIPDSCLLRTCSDLKYANPFEMYVDMYNGKSIEFDLTESGDKANFKINKNYTVNTLQEFKRKLVFVD